MAENKKQPTKISTRGVTPGPKSIAGYARLPESKLDARLAQAEARARKEIERVAAMRSAQDRKKTANRDFQLRTLGGVALAFITAAKRDDANEKVKEIATILELHITRPGARKSLGLADLTPEEIETITRLGVVPPPD